MKTSYLFFLMAVPFGLSVFGQTPTITSFNPKRGGVGTTITIVGSNFSPTPDGNIIWFGAVKSLALTATPTTITVKVPAGATYERISVTTGGFTAWTRENFLPTFAGTGIIDNNTLSENVDFPPVSLLHWGKKPETVDFDGDGKPDVTIASFNKISFYRNISTPGVIDSATLAPRYDLNISNNALSFSIIDYIFSDIDNDGKKDLLCLYRYTADIPCGFQSYQSVLKVDLAIYKNQSVTGSINSSSFAAGIVKSIASNSGGCNSSCSPSFEKGSLEKGDFNADGKEDLVIAATMGNSTCNQTNYGYLLQSNYTGSITTSTYTQSNNGAPNFLSVSNINTDSKPEIIGVLTTGDRAILRNISSTGGAITFTAGLTFGPFLNFLDSNSYFVDFDYDGKNDHYYNSLIRQNNVSSPIIDNSTFGQQFTLPGASSFSAGSTFLDVNGDGSIDICRINSGNATVGLTPNTHTSGVLATTSFGSTTIFATYGGNPQSVNCQDIDLDGKPDILFLNSGNFLSIMRNQTPSTGAILTLGTLSAGLGSTAVVPVTAETLNGVEGFQFTISYDPAKLSFQSCSDWAAGIDPANVTITDNAVTGKVTFIYNDQAFNIADGTFFNINFNTIATIIGSTPVTWSDDPTPREFIDSIPNILYVTYNNGTVNIVGALYNVSGTISYDNAASTAMGSITVDLIDNNNNIIATTTTSATGQYTFIGLANANYTVRPITIKPWGGGTSLDITLYKKHIGNVPGFGLSGLRLGSGDVNLSTTLTSIDLTLIKKRIGAQISSFTSGNWLFESGAITINGANLTKNIKAICYGDANGSNIPQ